MISEQESAVQIGDYIEKGYEGHSVFIPDQVYSDALDALVLACVDIFILYDKKAFIAKRAWHPQADWWLFGGRMKTGEYLEKSAQRLLRIEAGLAIEAGRFSYLTTFTSAWKMRAHAPQGNGTHTMSVVLYVVLNQSEFESVKLGDEYVEGRLVELDELTSGDVYHPVLGQCAQAYKNLL